MTESAPVLKPGGFFRRLAAILYDLLVFAAVLLVATVPYVLIAHGAPTSPGGQTLFRCYVLVVAFLFFGWFWVHGGQSLGMRAWRLRLVSQSGGAVSWKQAVLRFFAAILSWVPAGAGFLWILVDRDRRAWHDRLSGTRVVVIPKAGRKATSPPGQA